MYTLNLRTYCMHICMYVYVSCMNHQWSHFLYACICMYLVCICLFCMYACIHFLGCFAWMCMYVYVLYVSCGYWCCIFVYCILQPGQSIMQPQTWWLSTAGPPAVLSHQLCWATSTKKSYIYVYVYIYNADTCKNYEKYMCGCALKNK
jgi:hypothetical protein